MTAKRKSLNWKGGRKLKKLLVFLCAVTLVLGTIGVAGAVPITFTDTTRFYGGGTDRGGTDPNVDLVSYGGYYVNKFEHAFDWVKWTHHFDFDPAAAEVLSGTLTLSLRDDDDPWRCEFAFGWAEDGTWGWGEVDTGDYSYDITASYLEDGEFTITLASLWGDFYIDRSDLTITYDSVPVPEPVTMLLLGVGLIGLAGFSRKKFFKK